MKCEGICEWLPACANGWLSWILMGGVLLFGGVEVASRLRQWRQYQRYLKQKDSAPAKP